MKLLLGNRLSLISSVRDGLASQWTLGPDGRAVKSSVVGRAGQAGGARDAETNFFGREKFVLF